MEYGYLSRLTSSIMELEYTIVDELVGRSCNYCRFEFEGRVYELIYKTGENPHDAILSNIISMKQLDVKFDCRSYQQQ